MLKAQKKLDEAKFFLEKMRETYATNDFEHYINAFISSCRSIQWVLSSQFNKDESLKDWLNHQKPTDEESNIFAATNKIRVRSTKIESVSTEKMARIVIDQNQLSHLPQEEFNRIKKAFESGDFTGVNIRLHHKDEGYSSDAPPSGRVFIPICQSKAFLEVKEFPRQDILEVADKYFRLMESLVLNARLKLENNA